MISLNYRDSRPIYEQIKDGLKKLMVSGALAADEKLPSVRALATQLSINPNTIQRAYNELESEGYIYSMRHYRYDVDYVKAGSECGIGIDGFQDIKEGDVLEGFRIDQIARKE